MFRCELHNKSLTGDRNERIQTYENLDKHQSGGRLFAIVSKITIVQQEWR